MNGARATVTVRGGRRLGYAEYGDASGRPLLYFHGLPGSHVEARAFDTAAAASAVRVIAVDRPGVGVSDLVRRRTLLDWPRDVAALADALGLRRFGVLGVSGGGPYALACGYALADRIDAVGVVSGLAPLDLGGAREGLTERQRRARDGYLMLRRAPWLTRLVGWRMARHRHTADGGVTLVRSSMAPVDRARIDASPTLAAELRDNYRHAFLHGGRGVAQDLRVLCTGGWGFEPVEVAVPVWLWHGERDDNVPATDGRYLAAVLPRCHARFVADAGHLLFLDRSIQILAPWAGA